MGSMALVEKRPGQQQQQRRAGGCVGIFFQLLDWNRRLAKKKLFSRKLLPPVGSVKRVSKRFGGDDKMPTSKLKLIADENCGGFPNLKKPDSKQSFGLSDEDDVSSGMRTAGLVARLMGLETMPVVYQEKPRKALDSELYFDRDESWDCSRLDQDLCTEMGGNGKIDSRPQKIQKTGGFSERQPVNAARFSSDAFRFNKNMLVGSKKQHHKLPTPVKSPRTLPRRSTVRLMEAATKILDSGSHARNRALTYIGSSRAGGVQGANAGSFSRNSKDSVVGSCRSCGGLVEVPELRLGARGSMVTECGSSASDFSNASCSDAGSEEIRMKVHDEVASVVDQVKANAKSKASEFVERKYNIVKVEERNKCREDVVSKPGPPKPRSLRQSPLPLVKDDAVSVAKITSRQDGRRYPNEVNAAKAFVSSSKNLNKSTVSKPAKGLAASHKMVVMERNVGGKQLIRKRRPTGGSQSENSVLVNSKSPQERSAKGVCNNRKASGVTSDHSIGRNRIKSELRKRGDGGSSSVGKDNGAFSFTFTAPIKQKGSSSSLHKVTGEKSRSADKHTSELFDSKTVSPDAKNGSLASQRATTPLRGDALSSLLEQKIKELTSLDMDELAKGDENLGRSTASILEELISALTAGALISQKNADCCVDEHSVTIKSCHESTDCYEGDMLQNQTVSINKSLQEEEQPGFAAASPACENDQCSPISILGASFSNESSFSGSPNGSSGCRPEARLTESFNNKVRQLDLDKDLLDSATSIISEKCDSEKSLQSMDKHMKMNKFHPTDSRYPGRPISDIELLLENIFFNESNGTSESSLNKFLLNILESITEAFYVDSEFSSCCSEYEESNTVSSFLYDCMMEYLHSKYDGNFYNSGCKAWMRSHLFFDTDRLTTEIYEELKSWQSLSGKNTDDIIAKEMSQSIEKWTKCESNAFDTGIEIQADILQVLVEEIVVDLCRC
ncbi:hypothetical protein J5N97_027825 [Dioscorea zingiberensis]|uniref:DUF4378 domain-containing protein n=1 Tax=Dioscorea zingiberensis TaxID=325984 RepID=A0A9D5H489_9LILI|nr:hypothetical protein J5N97_027825 [Dioscorea zingiberensis]